MLVVHFPLVVLTLVTMLVVLSNLLSQERSCSFGLPFQRELFGLLKAFYRYFKFLRHMNS